MFMNFAQKVHFDRPARRISSTDQLDKSARRIREDRALLQGTDAWPANILLPGWSGGKDTALDITVVNPLQTAYIDQSAAVPGHALRKALERKMSKPGDSYKEVGLIFRPLPMDTQVLWAY